MGVRIKDRDRGYRSLVRRLYGLKKPKLAVGIMQAEGAEDHGGVTTLQVAQWMEFGTSTVPARSFLRAWFDENRARTQEMLRRILAAVVAGKYTPDQGLELLGAKFVGEIQRRIANRIPPPLKPETIARKGGKDVPLIDTGQLRSSISYKVER